jgi:hypothetical protein
MMNLVRKLQHSLAAGLMAGLKALLLVVGLGVASAQAEEVRWLYQVAVPVASQSVADREAAAGFALTEVLQRVSGHAVLPDSTRLRLAISQPDRYYDQFRYQRNQFDGSTELRVDFSAPAINDLSKALELPLWWANRPRVMLWSLDQSGRVIGAQDPEFGMALQQRARQRGLPLVLPMADETGIFDVSENAVRRADISSLAAYSSSYGAEVIVAGKLSGPPGNLAGRWVVELAGSNHTLSVRGADASQLGSALADRLADLLAAQFAVVGTARELQMVVAGVVDPRQYAQLLRYLGSLAFVDDTLVRSLAQGRLTLALQTQASQAKLLQLLAVDGLLIPENVVATRLRQRPILLPGNPGDSQDPLAGGQISVAPSIEMRWLGSPSS